MTSIRAMPTQSMDWSARASAFRSGLFPAMIENMYDASTLFPHLSRRGLLIAGGMAFSAVRGFAFEPACSLAAEQEEGPYYVDDEALRRDITEGKPGAPLKLAMRLVDSRSCTPL